MKISAGEVAALSSVYFGVVEVTFENNSPAWIQIDHIDLDFGSAEKNQSVFLPWGEDIETWMRATIQRDAFQTINERTQLTWAAIEDAVFRSAAGDRRERAAGGTVALGALAGLDAGGQEPGLETTRAPSRFPPTHLLSLPLRIPPGLFTRRWLLINTAAQPPGGCLDSFVLSYETADHTRGRVLLRFGDSQFTADWPRSVWQFRSCGGRGIGASNGHPLSAGP